MKYKESNYKENSMRQSVIWISPIAICLVILKYTLMLKINVITDIICTVSKYADA